MERIFDPPMPAHRLGETDGAVRLVSFNGKPATVRDEEIASLKRYLKGDPDPEIVPYVAVGKAIEIISGPFRGMRGVVEKHKGSMRVLLTIESVNQSLVLEIDSRDIIPQKNM